MARKPKHEEHVNLERYLVSYADFMTLMFILFIVMYALGGKPADYVRDFAAGIRKEYRIKPQIVPGVGSYPAGNSLVPLPLEYARQEQRWLEEAQQEIGEYVEEAGLEGKVETVLGDHGLTLRVQGAVLFDENSAAIRPDAQETLRRIGEVLQHFPSNIVRIEGHVDTIPFAPDSPYQSSWKLGADRAVSVAEYLFNRGLLKEEQAVVVSYGENYPLYPSDTPEHRAANRRVEITIERLADPPDSRAEEPIIPIPGISRAPSAENTGGASADLSSGSGR